MGDRGKALKGVGEGSLTVDKKKPSKERHSMRSRSIMLSVVQKKENSFLVSWEARDCQMEEPNSESETS